MPCAGPKPRARPEGDNGGLQPVLTELFASHKSFRWIDFSVSDSLTTIYGEPLPKGVKCAGVFMAILVTK
jgi:hypothetical protein